MSVADILREYGIAAIATKAPRVTVAAQTLVPSHATVATIATGEKYKAGAQPPKPAPASSGDCAGALAALLELADRLGIDPAHVHRIPACDLVLWAAIPGDALRTYLLALDDTATRQAGKVPLNDTAAIHCHGCGPVYVHPGIAAVLPVVDGWPRALGCPWCFVRKVGGYIPRPRVTCGTCRHFQPDTINLAAGVGGCASGHGTHYPTQHDGCGDFNPGNKR